MFELETESLRCSTSHLDDRLGVGLRVQHDTPIVAEVEIEQLWMSIETEPLPEQRFEVLGEEVGEKEGAELFLVDCLELLGPAEELVAVRTRKSRRLRVSFEQGVEGTTCTAVGIRGQIIFLL